MESGCDPTASPIQFLFLNVFLNGPSINSIQQLDPADLHMCWSLCTSRVTAKATMTAWTFDLFYPDLHFHLSKTLWSNQQLFHPGLYCNTSHTIVCTSRTALGELALMHCPICPNENCVEYEAWPSHFKFPCTVEQDTILPALKILKIKTLLH